MMRVSVLAVCLLALAGCRTAPREPAGPERPDLPVTVQTLPAMNVLVLAHTGPYEGMEATIDRFFSFMEQEGIEPVGELMAAFYDDPEKTPGAECRYEIRMPVREGVAVDLPFEVRSLPPTPTAGVTLVGSYEKIAERYGDLYLWVTRNGYRVAGPLLEVYLVHPGSGVPPAQYETEVHVPIEGM